jgi:hypothetical protein
MKDGTNDTIALNSLWLIDSPEASQCHYSYWTPPFICLSEYP